MTEAIRNQPTRCLVKRNPARAVKAYGDEDLQNHGSSGKRSRTNRFGRAKQSEEPFAAKVKRKWSNVKQKAGRRLGLYGCSEPVPLGLYVDIII